MKRITILSLFIMLNVFIMKSQNVLPDPGFEIANSGQTIGDGGASDCDYFLPSTFDNDLAYWDVAAHSNDKGERNPDWINDMGCLHTPLVTQCGFAFQPAGYHAYIAADISKCKKNWLGNFNIKQWHEAIRIALPGGGQLTNGTTYIIRFKVRPLYSEENDFEPFQECYDLSRISHMRVHITKLGVHWNKTIGNDKFEAVSANVIRNSSSHCQWEFIERQFTVPSSGTYRNLTLYMETGAFELDDVELFPVCTSQQFIQNRTYTNPGSMPTEGGTPFKEKVSNQIVSGFNVGALGVPVGNVFIQSGATVVYTAGSQIKLEPGFKSQNGSNFKAIIAGCPNSFRMDQQNQKKDSLFYSEKYKEWLSADDLRLYEYLEAFPETNENTSVTDLSISQSNENSFLVKSDMDKEFVSASIYDMQGKLIYQASIDKKSEFKFNLEAPAGIYLGKFTLNNGEEMAKKFLNNK